MRDIGLESVLTDFSYRQEFYVRFKGPEESTLSTGGTRSIMVIDQVNSSVRRWPLEDPCRIAGSVPLQEP